jgi:anti-sigma factor RsiW
MQCSYATTMIGAYLDGELLPDQAAAVQEHLGSCMRCSSEISEIARVQRSMRSARGHYAPSAEFRRKVQRQISRPRRRGWLFWTVPVGVAFATMILLTTFAWIGNARRSAAFAELADLHVNALSSTNLVDVISSDRHTVKPWFQGKIPFSFNLPEFRGTEYTLVGGRMVYFHQHPGAQLIVGLNQHKISVLIFQESMELGRTFMEPAALDRRTSFGIEAWQSRQLSFVLVSDADPAGIDNLARLLKQANE